MESLPREIKEHLIGFLDDRSKRMLRLANTQWFNYVKYNNFGIYFMTKKSAQEMADRLSKYSWPIHVKLQKSLTPISPLISHEFIKLTNMESLEIAGIDKFKEEGLQLHPEWQHMSVLTNIKKFSIGGIVGSNLRKQILQMTNLNSLGLSYQRFDQLDRMALFNMTNLRELSIMFCDGDALPLSYCSTNLTKIDITYATGGEDYESFDFSSYSQLKSLEFRTDKAVALSNLPSSLESLDLIASCLEYDTKFINHCTQMTRLVTLSSEELATNVEISPQILSRLKMFGTSTSEGTILSNLSKVEQLEITTEVDISSIQHLASSLQQLSITAAPNTDFNLIQQFSNLTRLKILSDYQIEWTSIAHLTKLQSFTLDTKSRLGPNPDFFTKSYAALTNLTYLEFSTHRASPDLGDTLTLLTRLGQLKLRMSFCDTKFWNQMARLTNLIDLCVITNGPSTIEDIFLMLDSLTKLTRLYLPVKECNEEQFQRFTRLSNLQKLIFGADAYYAGSELYTPTPSSLDEYRKKMPYLISVTLSSFLPED